MQLMHMPAASQDVLMIIIEFNMRIVLITAPFPHKLMEAHTQEGSLDAFCGRAVTIIIIVLV